LISCVVPPPSALMRAPSLFAGTSTRRGFRPTIKVFPLDPSNLPPCLPTSPPSFQATCSSLLVFSLLTRCRSVSWESLAGVSSVCNLLFSTHVTGYAGFYHYVRAILPGHDYLTDSSCCLGGDCYFLRPLLVYRTFVRRASGPAHLLCALHFSFLFFPNLNSPFRLFRRASKVSRPPMSFPSTSDRHCLPSDYLSHPPRMDLNKSSPYRTHVCLYDNHVLVSGSSLAFPLL